MIEGELIDVEINGKQENNSLWWLFSGIHPYII